MKRKVKPKLKDAANYHDVGSKKPYGNYLSPMEMKDH